MNAVLKSQKKLCNSEKKELLFDKIAQRKKKMTTHSERSWKTLLRFLKEECKDPDEKNYWDYEMVPVLIATLSLAYEQCMKERQLCMTTAFENQLTSRHVKFSKEWDSLFVLPHKMPEDLVFEIPTEWRSQTILNHMLHTVKLYKRTISEEDDRDAWLWKLQERKKKLLINNQSTKNCARQQWEYCDYSCWTEVNRNRCNDSDHRTNEHNRDTQTTFSAVSVTVSRWSTKSFNYRQIVSLVNWLHCTHKRHKRRHHWRQFDSSILVQF